jgi:Cof subfamily protein (haloacid dehalogenase superfamily)
MPRYRLLAIDIDGTLVNSRDELTPATRSALVRVGEAGIQVVLATGRRYSRTLHLLGPLGIDVPLVTASGALVKDPRDHRTLYRAEFGLGVLRRALETIARCGYEPLVCADTYHEGFDFYRATDEIVTPELCEYVRLNSDCGRLCPCLLTEPPPEVFAAFSMGTRDQMVSLRDALNQALPGKLSMHVLRSPKYTGFMCEVVPEGVTKWSAIRRLAHGWGVSDEEICAVGDDVNDVPMIRGAGLGVAMGNALPEVKAAADRIAPSHDADGLVHVVEWLLRDLSTADRRGMAGEPKSGFQGV